MRIIDCEQGSQAWIDARLGIPTASNFDQIITPKELKPSKSQEPYLARLLAEWLICHSLDPEVLDELMKMQQESQFMTRGKSLEEKGVAAYEWQMGVDTKKIGFALRDDVEAGASPDRLVDRDGLLEVKTPAANTHVMYMLNPSKLTDEYRMQVQGQLWVTGRKWCDIISHHPTLPMVVVRCTPDPDVMAALDKHMPPFCQRLAEAKAKYAEYKAVRRPAPSLDGDPFCTVPNTQEEYL